MTWIGWVIPKWLRKDDNLVPQKAVTRYLSIAGLAFQADEPDTDAVDLASGTADFENNNGAAIAKVLAAVNLPDTAIVTSCVVYGDAGAAAYWELRYSKVDDLLNDDSMANAAINTADTTITDATIDNSARYYYLYIDSLANTKKIYGAVIKYTLGGA